MKMPCKDCPDRHPGCHSVCEKYIADKEEWNNIKAKMAKEKHDFNLTVGNHLQRKLEAKWRKEKRKR